MANEQNISKYENLTKIENDDESTVNNMRHFYLQYLFTTRISNDEISHHAQCYMGRTTKELIEFVHHAAADFNWSRFDSKTADKQKTLLLSPCRPSVFSQDSTLPLFFFYSTLIAGYGSYEMKRREKI